MTVSDQTSLPGAAPAPVLPELPTDEAVTETPIAHPTTAADAPTTIAAPAHRPPIDPSPAVTERLRGLSSRYALLAVWLLMAAGFSIAKPDTFFGTATLQAVFGSQSSLLFLAMAALSTFVVGEFDLSFASVLGLSATILPVLATTHGMSVPLACAIAVGSAVACGCVNAFFIIKLGVSSLVVTLGTSSLILGLAELISGSAVTSVSNKTLTTVATKHVFGLPLSFYYGLGLVLIFAYVLSWTPLGRHIVFVGANREVARLAGVHVDRIRAGSYIVGSLIAGLAGVLLVASVGGFDPTGSSVYLLPALAAVFLGTAIVQPGQFNPLGTWIGIYFLATGILGLQLLGYTGWVQDAFYGGGLVLAVSVATIVRTRTSRAR